jgi:hypothetical protein
MMSKIKITNVSNHIHSVRMLNPMTGTYLYRKLNPKQFVVLTEDQFLDLYNTSVDFESGILAFDEGGLSEDVLSILGYETKEEATFGIVSYDEKQIKAVLTGKIGEFNSFIKQLKELEIGTKTEFSKKVFSVAEKSVDEITKGKADTIEVATGMKFDINAEFKNTK